MNQQSGWVGKTFALFGFYLILSIAFTWPLPQYLFDGIPYAYDADPNYAVANLFMGDHLQYYYHLGLMKHAATGHIAWFTNPLEFATPYQPDWFFSYSLPISIIYLPFSFISLPLAYNLFLLITLALGGLFMHLWAKDRLGSSNAAFVAGVTFNYFPYRMVEMLGGHPSGFIVFLIPLTLFFFDRAVARRSFPVSLAAGGSIFTLAFQYNYFAYYFFMFLMVYIPWRLVPIFTEAIRNEKFLVEVKTVAFAGIPFAFGSLASLGWMYYYKKSVVETTTLIQGRTIGEVSLFSPPLVGMWDVSSGWEVYLGLAGLMAISAFLIAIVNPKRFERRSEVLFFGGMFLLSYALAFGLSLDSYFPIYKIFYKYFPYFNFSRAPAKIMIITTTCMSILAGYMVVWLSVRFSGKGTLITAIVCVMIVVNYHPGKLIGICSLDENNKTYRFLAETGEGKPILNLPIWPGEASWEAIYQYYSVQSGVPMVNGYSPIVKKEHVDNIFWPFFPTNSGDFGSQQYALTKKLGIKYIVFHANAFPPKVSAYSPYHVIERLKNNPYLVLVRNDDPLWVFEVLKTEQELSNPLPVVGLYFEAESLPHISGKAIEEKNALNDWVLHGEPLASNGADGMLNAGPYVTLPSGSYQLMVNIRVDNVANSGDLVKIDIVGNQGKTILAEETYRADDFSTTDKYVWLEIPFDLKPGVPWQVEFRAYLLGKGEVDIDAFYVLPLQERDPRYSFEAEDLFYYSGRKVDMEDASGGAVIRSSRPNSPADMMVHGPKRFYNAGSYEATIRYKTEGNNPLFAVTVEVVKGAGVTEIAKKSLSSAGEGWRNVSLPFLLRERTIVDVNIIFGGKDPVSIDSVVITKK